MRKKINTRFIGIAVFSIVITILAMTAVFYTQLKLQIFSDLETVSELLTESGRFEKNPDQIRITVIEPDGKVSYDSEADIAVMENHLDRPEVKAAAASGSGYGVRRSETMSESIFYYAKRLDDNRILRVGKEAHNVLSVLYSTLPVVFVTAVLLALISMTVSRYLTAEILQPIDEMAANLDDMNEEVYYPEFIPFIRKIRSQHEDILSSANIRQEFTANVSHELKTPLAAISGYAELMETGLVNEKDIRHFSGEIRKSAGRLLVLINDIIKISQLDAGNAGEVLEIINIAEIAKDSVKMLTLGANKKGVSLTYGGMEEAWVRTGKELGQELVYNLIENAVRYNRPGGYVHVNVMQDREKVILSVEDNGIGISKEHQERIFERFYRVDKSRSKELGGTGLGLAIVKHICTLTGGEIRLDSEPDAGTSIRISWGN